MGKKLILVIMLCVFQMGVSLLLFPVWNRLFTEREVMHSAERFLSEAAAPSQNQIQRIPIQRNRRNPMQSFGKKCVLITIISMLKNRLI